MRATTDAISDDIATMDSRAKRFEAEGELTIVNGWRELGDRMEDSKHAAAKLESIEEACEGAWAELAFGFVDAYQDLSDASERAIDQLNGAQGIYTGIATSIIAKALPLVSGS